MPLFQLPGLFQRNKENSSFNGNHHHHHHGDKGSANGSNSDLKIGEPTNFQHNINVKHDKTRNEFIGLPDEWRSLLETNNIK